MQRARIYGVLFLVAAIAFVWLRSSAGPEVEEGSVLELRLSGDFVEATDAPLIARLLGPTPRPLAGLLSEFAKAERDPRLSRVVLRIGRLGLSWAKAQEIRDAIVRLRDAGHPTTAFLEVESFGGNLEYYVATGADEIYLAPGAPSPLVGLKSEYLFFGGLGEKLGLEIDAIGVGEYKSAIETIRGRTMSQPHREMANSILDSIHGQFVDAIAKGRSLKHLDVVESINAAPMVPEEMVSRGLLDGVVFYDELFPADSEVPRIASAEYARVDPATVGFDPIATFALIYGSGDVISGEGTVTRRGDPVFASETVIDALDQAAKDSEISAIVLRIDSPGGSAPAATAMWHAVRKAAQAKPVVASFSDLAASAGYYVGSAATAIVAQPATLTGSIGVFVIRPSMGGLLDKLDIGHETLFRGAHADLLAATVPMSAATRERFGVTLEEAYARFVRDVAIGRGLEPAQVDPVARGRVWTGEQAQKRDLVDELGGLRAAVLRAKQEAQLQPDDDVSLTPYPAPKALRDQLGEVLRGSLAKLGAPPLPRSIERLLGWVTAFPAGSLVSLPPIVIEIR